MNPIAEGETVLWTGQPQRYQRRFRDFLPWVLVVWVIVWLGLAFAFLEDASAFVAPYVVGLVVALAIVVEKQRPRVFAATSYILTDRRLIFVLNWAYGVEYRWVPIAQLGTPRVRELKDGLGIVSFDRSVLRWLRQRYPWRRPTFVPVLPELMAIPDARQVAELIARNAPQPSIVG
ncbi:hypothetical protein VSH64_28165 [Amycolatopsis rhabdoformis]|uniref:PH domain-containing protein n=1 Tax=Amycolatopsis rhabdoformis TaxID=1448059 RepID=A0ABZ1HZG7_9PSEU|nr:hypothetical protein [Amycolatopsis rhabdoformis]WSE26753.1 hypothetical protein VSH64_28165 [Amycolatopsis rhabdoformis]